MKGIDQVDNLVLQGNLERALNQLKRLRKKDPANWDLSIREAEILREMGQPGKALEVIYKLERTNNLDFIQNFDLDLEKIYCFWAQFEIEKADDFSKALMQSVSELQEFDSTVHKSRIARLYHLMGIINAETGKYHHTVTCHEKAINLYRELGNRERLALMLNNYGFTNSLMGNIEIAEEAYKEGMEIYHEIGKLQDKARITNNLGILKFQKEEYDEAETLFLNGLTLQKKVKNALEISYSLFELVKFKLIQKLNPSEYLEELRQLSYDYSEPIVRLRYQLSKAMVLKSIRRFKSKVEAQQILEDIAWDSHLPQRYTLIALKHLAEIKFDELQTYGDETILYEIEELIQQQLKVSQEQRSRIGIIEANLLLSKLELIKGEVQKSKDLIQESLEMAEESGLYQLAKLASQFYDQLLTQLDYWKQISPNIDLEQKLKKADVFSFLRDIQYENLGTIIIDREIPVLFLIISPEGSVKMTMKFSAESQIHEQMIGTFISAINSFFSEAFLTGNNIERVNSNDYSILLKPEYGLTFCYIFKGQSYYATRKLRDLIAKLKVMKSYQDFILNHGASRPFFLNLTSPEIIELKQVLLS